jgi:uncharacterized protein
MKIPMTNGGGHPKVVDRDCGRCSLCCNLLYVIELNKPANTWCPHCRPGHGGCTIYDTRPSICRTYACGWLMSDKVGPEWYPLLSHMVLSLGVLGGIQTVTVTVDPNFSGIWREHPYYHQLKAMAYRGLHVKSADDILLVQVRVNDQVWLVLPNNDVEITHGSYIVKCTGAGNWEVEFFSTQDQAAQRAIELIR